MWKMITKPKEEELQKKRKEKDGRRRQNTKPLFTLLSQKE